MKRKNAERITRLINFIRSIGMETGLMELHWLRDICMDEVPDCTLAEIGVAFAAVGQEQETRRRGMPH